MSKIKFYILVAPPHTGKHIKKFCGIWGNEEKKYKRKVKENKKLAGLLGSPPSIYSKKKIIYLPQKDWIKQL